MRDRQTKRQRYILSIIDLHTLGVLAAVLIMFAALLLWVLSKHCGFSLVPAE